LAYTLKDYLKEAALLPRGSDGGGGIHSFFSAVKTFLGECRKRKYCSSVTEIL
jgi:hypothetical protein